MSQSPDHFMKRLIQVFCLMLFSTGASHALVDITDEGHFAFNFELAAHEFAEANSGRSPSSWEDFHHYFSKPIDEVFPQILPTKRYAFLEKPVRMRSDSDFEILIIARKPIRESHRYRNWLGSRSRKWGEPGRYALTRSKSEGFMRQWLSEIAVQRIFRDANTTLPEPDKEPNRPPELTFYLSRYAEWIVLTGVLLGMVGIWFINRKNPAAQAESTGSSP
jgi:hypothetical protein